MTLSSLTNLQELEVSEYNMTGSFFDHIANFNPRLMKLCVHEGFFERPFNGASDGDGEGEWSNVSSISSLVHLKELTLNTYHDTGLHLSHLQELTELTKIDVTIFADGSIESLTNLKKLSELRVDCV